MESVIVRSSQLAQKIVNESLQEEQARFDRENSLKKLSVQDTIALAVDTVFNLLEPFSGRERSERTSDKFRRDVTEIIGMDQISDILYCIHVLVTVVSSLQENK